MKKLFLGIGLLLSSITYGQGHFQSSKYICTTGNDEVFIGKHTLLLRDHYLTIQFEDSKWCLSIHRATTESGKIDSIFYNNGRGIIYYTPDGKISSVWLKNPNKQGKTYYFRKNWATDEKNQQ